LLQFHRIDGTLVDVSDRDVEEIGLQYFNSIPKMEHNKSSKNYADLLVEDVGDNDALTDSKKFNDSGLNERYGNETDRSNNGENQPYLPATQTEALSSGNSGNGGNGCNPAQQSSQSRRSSPNPSRTSVSRVKSIFMETASSLLPILYSSSSSSTTPPVRTDYSSSVQHRVSTKNHVNLEEPNCDDSFLSGVSATKFLSPDENRLKSKNKELLKSLGQGQGQGQDEHLPVQDLDRGNLNQPPEKWKQRRLSSTPTSPPPTNYKSSSNQCVDDYKPKNTQNREYENFHEYRNDGNKSRYSSSKLPNENENGTIRYRRKTQTRSNNSDARDSDDNSSKSGSDDVMMKSGIIAHTPEHISGPNSGHISGPNSGHVLGPNSGHISGPTSGHISGPNSGHISGLNSGHISGPNSGHISGPNSGHISGPNSGNNQMPILVHPRQKSLTPLMDKVNSNYRDNYQRERGDINDKNSYIRNESETISDVINFESHKPHAPLGIREPQGENFRGLQMQKILSSVQNAQLQKEVDALQRQLAQLEELEGKNISI
jgi:hypothetical protein